MIPHLMLGFILQKYHEQIWTEFTWLKLGSGGLIMWTCVSFIAQLNTQPWIRFSVAYEYNIIFSCLQSCRYASSCNCILHCLISYRQALIRITIVFVVDLVTPELCQRCHCYQSGLQSRTGEGWCSRLSEIPWSSKFGVEREADIHPCKTHTSFGPFKDVSERKVSWERASA